MRPAFRIIANESADITALVSDRLLSLEITDKAGVKSDRLSISLDDRDQRFEIPRTGAPLEVSIGYVGQALVRMGKYIVDEVEVSGPARTMTISANAVDMTGSLKAPKERSFDDITLGALVQTIAGDHGLTPSIPAALASRNLGHIDQTESDLQLLTRICSEQGATCKVADGRLVVAERAAGKTASGGDLPQALIDASDCASWTATVTERGKYKSAKAYHHDLVGGERKEAKVGEGEPSLTLRNSYTTEEDAKQAAQSKLAVANRGTRKVRISGLVGNTSMSAERVAVLTGFRAGIDGADYIIDSVTHSISDGGYTCNLDIESKS